MEKNIALVLGIDQANKIENSIGADLDTYRFFGYNSLPEALEASEENDLEFDRILIFETRLTNPATRPGLLFEDTTDPRFSELENLNNFLQAHERTTVVVICTVADKFTQVSNFIDKYMSLPNVTPITPQSTTVQMLKKAISSDLTEVIAEYYTHEKKKAKKRVVNSDDEETSSRHGRRGRRGKAKDFTEEAQESAKSAPTSRPLGVEEYQQSSEDDEFAGPAGNMGMENEQSRFSDYSESPSGVQNYPMPEENLGGLSFGGAGASHEETGVLNEDDEDDEWSAPNSSYSPQEPANQSNHVIHALPESGGDLDEATGYVSVGEEGLGGVVPAEVGGFNSKLSSHAPVDDETIIRARQGIAVPEVVVPQIETPVVPPILPLPVEEETFEQWQARQAASEAIPAGGVVSNGYSSETSVASNGHEEDDKLNIRDRIIFVTGDRGSGITTKAGELALESVGNGNVLLIDLDFRKHGVLGILENFNDFVKSGDHSIVSGNAYNESGIDVLSDGWGSKPTQEAYDWVCDSRNYANYNKVIVDCPIEYIGEVDDLLRKVGVVYMLDGSQSGLMSMISMLDDRSKISDELALTLRNRGQFCVIRKESGYRTVLNNMGDEIAVDRVDWLAKIS